MGKGRGHAVAEIFRNFRRTTCHSVFGTTHAGVGGANRAAISRTAERAGKRAADATTSVSIGVAGRAYSKLGAGAGPNSRAAAKIVSLYQIGTSNPSGGAGFSATAATISSRAADRAASGGSTRGAGASSGSSGLPAANPTPGGRAKDQNDPNILASKNNSTGVSHPGATGENSFAREIF